MAAKRILVFGGNGFLGSRICKSAVSRGWDVTSIRYELALSLSLACSFGKLPLTQLDS